MNILVLTSVYRDPDFWETDSSTMVVNSFVSDWVKMGHRVIVIHNAHQYPRIIYMLPDKQREKLSSLLGFPLPKWDAIKEKTFTDNGAKVWRLPMLKLIPHKGHSDKKIVKQAKKIECVLQANGFKPDVILGHWVSPQMEIISKLKDTYGCRTAVVLHGGVRYLKENSFHADDYVKKIDKIGARSKTQANKVCEALNLKEMPFVCYSGVPDEFLKNYTFDEHKFEKKPETWKFIYAGRLVKYKAIDKTLKALSKLKNQNFTFDVIGDGGEKDNLIALSKELGLDDRVTFHGRIPREDVLRHMRDAHVFILISKGEIFGLVYLEAMAATCISVGSIGEGIDGVIEDGENGLLCEAQNEDALLQRLEWLMNCSPEELNRLVKKGYETAQDFADSKVAERYLEDVMS
jgi:glycosyltransferase involved in cell wall biosynthesis